jgi:hypothetical protein
MTVDRPHEETCCQVLAGHCLEVASFASAPAGYHVGSCGGSQECSALHIVLRTKHSGSECVLGKKNSPPHEKPFVYQISDRTPRPLFYISVSHLPHNNVVTHLQTRHQCLAFRSLVLSAPRNFTVTRSENIVSKFFVFRFLTL